MSTFLEAAIDSSNNSLVDLYNQALIFLSSGFEGAIYRLLGDHWIDDTFLEAGPLVIRSRGRYFQSTGFPHRWSIHKTPLLSRPSTLLALDSTTSHPSSDESVVLDLCQRPIGPALVGIGSLPALALIKPYTHLFRCSEMAARIQLTTTVVMNLDGQPQVVLPASVIDVADASIFAKTATVLAETAGTLGPNNSPASVRNVGKR